ncbi:MAG: hypothetical protein A2762_05430 [Candidatus Lloydbacteria bacterium RIFCSPHIGHO2_01_FULL_54_11]|nr:MAG: hypothetical protein A2762_05430 [Candidatus Lloydbacteria bacterium RIFCSPHIGHO2_01_FULL_54_11]OGZ14908.1 MAG: hypothetical protein A2948_05260 [Candidatus Lloydbacteria bacterium RIFCSPLOWO2_01_FULL_54_18]
MNRGAFVKQFLLRCFSIVIPLCALFAASAFGADEAPPAPRISPEISYARVLLADTLCKGETLEPTTKKEKGKTVIAERPVILCAYKESDKSWHVVKLLVQYPLPDCFRKTRLVDRHDQCGAFPFRTLTPEYGVEHVSGLGIPRLVFSASHQGEPLKIYRYRHIWFADHMTPVSPAAEMLAKAVWIEHTPYAKEFHDDEHVRAGAQFLYGKIVAAQNELRTAGLVSRTYPPLLVADVVSWKHLMNLGLIEQMDHDSFNGFGVCLSPDERGIPEDEIGRRILCKEESARKTTEAILVEYALNREQSFRYSISSARAVGPYQFTDRGGNGTYAMVVRECKAAQLIPSFMDGATDLGNVIKAAACLLDLELAGLPPAVQLLYATNPRIGGIYPVAAYNEGGGGARELYRRIQASKIDLAVFSDEAFELPRKVFDRSRECVGCRKGGSQRARTIFNEETYMYIKKYLYVWKFVDELALDGTPVSRRQTPSRP